MSWLDNVSVSLLNKDLDGLWARQQAISDNLANVETPGYTSKTVNFEDQLTEKMSLQYQKRSNRIHAIESVNPIEIDSGGQLRADGNGVDVEKENMELARTQLNYAYSLRGISDQFSRLRIAIVGRNG